MQLPVENGGSTPSRLSHSSASVQGLSLTFDASVTALRMIAVRDPQRELPRTWSDERLLACMLRREGVAWKEFVRRYRRLILNCIDAVTRRFHRVVGNADVEDIYGSMMCGLHARDMHRLRAFQVHRGVKLSTWIGLLARNAAWDYLRALARHNAVSEHDESASSGAHEDTPEQALRCKQDCELALSVLRELSARDQTFLQLYFIDGMEADEVAREMGISTKTVYSKKHKLRSRLKDTFDGS